MYATAETILDVYTDPQVAASASSCEITPAGLLDANATLYLVAPPSIANVSLFSFARTAQLMDDARAATSRWLEQASPVRPQIDVTAES